jgi:hypothetical protein
MGEKLAAYVRPSGALLASLAGQSKGKGKGKGKGKANGAPVEIDLKEDSKDAVVYEVYKVSSLPWVENSGFGKLTSRQRGVHLDSENITAGCSSSSYSSSRAEALSTSVTLLKIVNGQRS